MPNKSGMHLYNHVPLSRLHRGTDPNGTVMLHNRANRAVFGSTLQDVASARTTVSGCQPMADLGHTSMVDFLVGVMVEAGR